MVHVGADDPTIPAEQLAAIDAMMSRTEPPFEQHVYPGAGHAFACDARPLMYRDEAAEQAWVRTHRFLDHHLPSAA